MLGGRGVEGGSDGRGVVEELAMGLFGGGGRIVGGGRFFLRKLW
jgi:hypothetical protein